MSFPDLPPEVHLDEAGRVGLRPDLCLLDPDQRIAWVGDAKYKRLPSGAYRHADLYQMLAYLVAMDLQGGTLVYAADEGVSEREHRVARTGKTLRVVALDLGAPVPAIRRQVAALARTILAATPGLSALTGAVA